MEFETSLRRLMKRFNKEVHENTHKVGAGMTGKDSVPPCRGGLPWRRELGFSVSETSVLFLILLFTP